MFNYGDIGLEPEKDASKTMASKYLVACLEKYADDNFILFFLNLEDHWVTILICLPWSAVYYFDSLLPKKTVRGRFWKPIKSLMNTAWKVATKGKLAGKGYKDEPHHNHRFPCQQQLPGSLFCGYYCCHILMKNASMFKSEWKGSVAAMEEYRRPRMTMEHRPKWVVYNIQREFVHLINNEVIKPSGDFFERVEQVVSRVHPRQ
ncbi:hypothetical protein BRADI_5g08724v3 [Brachypodium distachyon]|uniref:Ubiquitin-like protease family profile domain-containing protein n=1 Tax=Brachypodium distachyon TaxID=15368 RepID=A0A2K2CG12_BRADI|nr:hypothetical protein BRADI_5g08724v3 [Brachypodium distachyon]